jgi:hypothetical protein
MRHTVSFRVMLLGHRGTDSIFFSVMGVFYCGLAIQTFVVCEQNSSWKNLPLPQCPLGKEVAIAQLVSELYYPASI